MTFLRGEKMHIRTARDLGLLIRDRRRSLGLDQSRLAQRVGVSRQWVIEVEKGKARAEVGLLLRTLQALGLRVWAEVQDREASPGEDRLDGVDINAVVDRARKTDDAE